MYALVSNGSVVGFCEKPNYVVKRSGMNAYYATDNKDEAEGIEFAGQLYNFKDSNKIENRPEIDIIYRDGMQVVFSQQNRISINENNTVVIEEALMDVDAVTDERLTVLEDAIIELDAAMNA